MSDYNHGQTLPTELEILSIDTKINRFGKISIEIAPKFPYTNKVLQLTAEHVDQIARSVGASNRFMLADAVNLNPHDPSYLAVVFTFKKEGEQIGFQADGVTPIVSKKTGKTVFDKDYWDSDVQSILVGESGLKAVAEIKALVQKDLMLADITDSKKTQADARRKRLGFSSSAETLASSSSATPQVEAVVEDDDDEVI